MISNAGLKRMSRATKRRWLSCAAGAMLLLSFGLTSCGSVSSAPKASSPPSLAIYQPPVLRLKAGAEVETVDGVYRAPTDEVWHSNARWLQLEQENLNLAAALAQERARATTR